MKKLLALLFVLLLSTNTFASWQGNGSSQHVQIADSAIHTIPDATNLTFVGWAYVISNAGSSSNVMLGHSTISSASSYGIYCREAANSTPGAVQFAVEDDDSDPISHNSGATVPCSTVDTWFHFAFVITGNITYGYINGVQTSTGNSGNFDDVDPPTVLTVLSHNGASYFNGRVAELARYSRGLTAAEIAAHVKYAPTCFPGKVWYLPAIREYHELVGKLTVTNVGSTVAAHPPLIRC